MPGNNNKKNDGQKSQVKGQKKGSASSLQAVASTTSGDIIGPLVTEDDGPKHRIIDETAEEDSSDDELESGSDDDGNYVKEDTPEVPSEFWHLQKLIKYTKAGNQTATTVALCLLKNYELDSKVQLR